MKIYTKTGDTGETGLLGGKRIAKTAVRIETYGTLDECNAVLGIAQTCAMTPQLHNLLETIQSQLFVLGSELATPEGHHMVLPHIEEDTIEAIEKTIDLMEGDLVPLKQFILPGGTPASAHLHLARTVCRRAERFAVKLHHEEPIRPIILKYLNRLSDFLFVAARYANHQAGVQDVPWHSPHFI